MSSKIEKRNSKNKSKRNCKKGGFDSKGKRTASKNTRSHSSKRSRKSRKTNNMIKSIFPFVVNK